MKFIIIAAIVIFIFYRISKKDEPGKIEIPKNFKIDIGDLNKEGLTKDSNTGKSAKKGKKDI